MKNKLLITALLFLSSACSNIKGDWACPVLKGGKGNCASISEADQGNITNTEPLKINSSYLDSKQKIKISLIAPKLKDLGNPKLDTEPQPSSSPELISIKNQKQLRTEEKVGRIWFAPFIDSDGNQHGESIVYVVDETSKWISER